MWTLNISKPNSSGIVRTCSDRSKLSLLRTAAGIAPEVFGGHVGMGFQFMALNKLGKHAKHGKVMINHAIGFQILIKPL